MTASVTSLAPCSADSPSLVQSPLNPLSTLIAIRQRSPSSATQPIVAYWAGAPRPRWPRVAAIAVSEKSQERSCDARRRDNATDRRAGGGRIAGPSSGPRLLRCMERRSARVGPTRVVLVARPG